MAFEGVEVSNMKMATNSFQTSIYDNKEQEIMHTLEGNTIWNTSARDKLIDAMYPLPDHYKKLKNYISNMSQIANLIEQYKEYEKKINSLHSQIRSLSKNLWYTSSYINAHGVSKKKKRKNYEVQAKIDALEERIEEYERYQERIIHQVEELSNR